MSGLLGVLARPFFHHECGIIFKGNTIEAWKSLGINLLGAVVIIAWTAVWSCLVFGGLKWFEILRVDLQDEHFGLDLTEHGESAYPADAWIEIQYQNTQINHAGRIGPMENQANGVPRQRENARRDYTPRGGTVETV